MGEAGPVQVNEWDVLTMSAGLRPRKRDETGSALRQATSQKKREKWRTLFSSLPTLKRGTLYVQSWHRCQRTGMGARA